MSSTHCVDGLVFYVFCFIRFLFDNNLLCVKGGGGVCHSLMSAHTTAHPWGPQEVVDSLLLPFGWQGLN